MNALTILALRVLLVVIFVGALLVQVRVVPLVALEIAGTSFRGIAVPYAVAGIATIACVQLALVCLWMLLSMVRRDAIFTDRAFAGSTS